MRLHIIDPKHLIEYASVDVTVSGLCVLHIRTADRCHPYQRTGGCELLHDDTNPVHQCVVVEPTTQDADDDLNAHVIAIAETTADAALLQGIAYTQADKDAIDILFVPRDLLRGSKAICTFLPTAWGERE